MTRTKVNPVIRVFPSLTDFAFLLPVIFLFARMNGVNTLLGDGDTGWHLRAGEWMLANGRIVREDIFSYTKPGEPWFAWEWLWDISFAALHQRWGMTAVVWTSILILCLTSALVFRLARRRSGDPFAAILVTTVAVVASSLHWLARPHLLTLLFTVIFLTILERVAEGRWRLLALLPLLTIPWANFHGGFFVGVIILCAYAAGELVRAAVAPDVNARAPGLRAAGRYGITAALCAAASLVNPYGYRLHSHIFNFLLEPYHREHINEFQSINFQSVTALFFEALLLLAAFAAFRYARKFNFAAAALLLIWGHMALYSARNVPLFCLMAAPAAADVLAASLRALQAAPVASVLRRLAGAIREAAGEFEAIDRIPRAHVASAAVMLLLLAVMSTSPAAGQFATHYDTKRYPAQAVERLAGELTANRVFTDDEWGDYLIYRLFPRGRVFVDGRSDFYGGKFGQTYLDVMNVKFGWEDHLRGFGVNMILLRTTAPLAGALKQSARWRPIHDDGIAIVFRAASESPHTRISAVTAAEKSGSLWDAGTNPRTRRAPKS